MRGKIHDTIDLTDARPSYDAVVMGAGPAGCGVAACLAARGASVLLIESNPNAARRFAGEWIHPEGARVLREQELLEGLASPAKAEGFVVCANDGLDPIRLDYPEGNTGFACEHETLVSHLRDRVRRLPRVEYIEGVRGRALGADAVELLARKGGSKRIAAERVVVAGGRSARNVDTRSGARQVPISSMAGLLVTDAELPVDGFGHVILGGPGPVLAYRIDERRIRLCIDLPRGIDRGPHTSEWIWETFSEVLPRSLRIGVRDALSREALSWAANAFRPRCYQTASGVALVGDAAGVFHPLTAMGITMSLLDAEALAAAPSLDAYAARRATASYVPELLSNAIYQAFVRDDPGSEAIRESIFESWRASGGHRARTMRLLGASSTSRVDFIRAFSRVALRAGAGAITTDRAVLLELAGWLKWPWASVHPASAEIRSRSSSWAMPQSWTVPDSIASAHHIKEKRHAS